MWLWNLTDDLENNRAPLLSNTSFVHHFIATCQFILNYSPKRLIWVKIGEFLSRVTLKFDRCPWKTKGLSFYGTSSDVHHFKAMGVFKLELQSWNANFGSKSTIVSVAWPWNLADDLEKQQDTSPKQHQALRIILSPCVNSNWSYGTDTAKLGFDLCDLDLWLWNFAWTLHLSLVITRENFMMMAT